MGKNRLEAFSDGVLAIIITIMVLEIKMPHSPDWAALQDLLPVFISYLLSFVFVGIYWGNHHHLLHIVNRVSGGIIWANLNLLFWLSLIPFATGWMGENHFAQNTVIVYAGLLMACGVAYTILQKVIKSGHKTDDRLAATYASQERKGLISLVLYAASIGFAFYNTTISGLMFLIVSILWIIPDKNIERLVEGEH